MQRYHSEVSMRTPRFRLNKMAYLGEAKITLILDCSEQKIQRATDERVQEMFYSGKKGFHSLSILLGCAPDGFIYFLSPSHPGSLNDMNIANINCEMFSELEQEEWVLGDAGFVGIEEMYSKCILPRKGKVDREAKNFNTKISKLRIVVENVFAHLQDWNICKHVYRAHSSNEELIQKEHNTIWRVVSALFNKFTAPLVYQHELRVRAQEVAFLPNQKKPNF